MGCDIHARLEIKLDDTWFICLDKDGEPLEPFYNRNYNVFAMLANVRNYGDLISISQRKGIPEDASIEVNTFIREYGVDGHSHSYLTLQDLLNYDLIRDIEQTGLVSFKDFANWHPFKNKNDTGPRSWSSVVFNKNAKTLTQKEGIELYENIVKESLGDWQKLANLINESQDIYVDCSWTQTYSHIAGEILTRAIPMMTSVCIKLGLKYDQVRAVFFFDN